jgi:3',5'-cyclic AMP phosphodiesterase CpdA
MFVLAHLSDPHLGPIPAPRLAELFGKRAIGYLNWRRNRRGSHREEILAALVADLHAQAPDHIAVTGDLVNIALAAEFAPARQWLESLGQPYDVTVIPGNHDAYVRKTAGHSNRIWRDYMGNDGDAGLPTFPFLRRRGPLALIGVSSALPTAPFMATGHVGSEQRTALGEMLQRLGQDGAFRVVLVHHPLTGGTWHKRLTDARKVRAVLARQGAELVLHGHDHVHSIVCLDGPRHRIPVIGVPSASARGIHHQHAAYNLYRIEERPNGPYCEMISRGFRDDTDGVVELRREVLLG